MFVIVFLVIHSREIHESSRKLDSNSNRHFITTGDKADVQAREDDLLQFSLPISTKSKFKNKFLRSITNTEKVAHISSNHVNNTRKAESLILFFNRVPKVGSQTFMELLRRLSIRNGFYFNRDRVQKIELVRLNANHQMDLAGFISQFEQPASYIKHVCFINFTRYSLPQPIYVNLVRDPVERVISWYYYVRAPWYYVERKQLFPDLPLPDPFWLKKDFETCVLHGDKECTYLPGETEEGIGDHRRQSMFFCGHDEDCTPFNTDQAIKKAKNVVENFYSVVGVLEDLNTTLTVLEHYIPQFFQGATEIYWNEVNNLKRINGNMFKPLVSEKVKDIVRKNFSKEIEFYDFCKQRLYRQLQALQLQ